MNEHKIRISTSWTGDNFCGAWEDEHDGVVLVTAGSLQELKDNFVETISFHVNGCIEDGDIFPDYLINGDYDIELVDIDADGARP